MPGRSFASPGKPQGLAVILAYVADKKSNKNDDYIQYTNMYHSRFIINLDPPASYRYGSFPGGFNPKNQLGTSPAAACGEAASCSFFRADLFFRPPPWPSCHHGC